jgi:hypothetical protein
MTPIASAPASRKAEPFVPANSPFQDLTEVNPPSATERTGLLLKATYPFLLRNFNEAPQYASFRPSNPLVEHPSVVLDSVGVAATSCAIAPATAKHKTRRPPSRRYQWELDAEAIQVNCRLDNLHLRLENHLQRDPTTILRLPSCRNSGSYAAAPRVVQADLADAVATKKPRGRPKKAEANRLKPYLQNFVFPKDALSALPMFDDIVKGAVVADAGGNTRPFSKSRMIRFLQSLDVISVEAIRQHEPQWSLRHAQKVAMCLRIIERHAFDIAVVQWHIPDDTDWTGID